MSVKHTHDNVRSFDDMAMRIAKLIIENEDKLEVLNTIKLEIRGRTYTIDRQPSCYYHVQKDTLPKVKGLSHWAKVDSASVLTKQINQHLKALRDSTYVY